MTGIRAAHLDLIRMAFAGLIVGTGRRVAGNLRGFMRRTAAAGHPVIFALLKTFAASLICNFCPLSSHMDIVLAAGIFLIEGTVHNRTI